MIFIYFTRLFRKNCHMCKLLKLNMYSILKVQQYYEGVFTWQENGTICLYRQQKTSTLS